MPDSPRLPLLVALTLSLLALSRSPSTGVQAATFIRGDSNGDAVVDLSDSVRTLRHLFLADRPLHCPDAADANDDGELNISDPVATLQHLFLGGDPLPPPNGPAGDDPTPDDLGCGLRFEEITMECMDLVSNGGALRVVVDTQEEYEQTIDERFQRPLDEYWNENYERVKQGVIEQNPGLSDEESERRVREIFYSVRPFRGTENCTHPVIDFSRYTLLGQDAHSSGCSAEHAIELEQDDENRRYVFKVTVVEHGSCEPFRAMNKWVLLDKIIPEYSVEFLREDVRTAE